MNINGMAASPPRDGPGFVFTYGFEGREQQWQHEKVGGQEEVVEEGTGNGVIS